eukprot:scaffold10327_cov70-Phaeocystis_antarctica.AAC.2
MFPQCTRVNRAIGFCALLVSRVPSQVLRRWTLSLLPWLHRGTWRTAKALQSCDARAQPPLRPGRSASAAEAAKAANRRCASSILLAEIGAHAVAHHLPRPRRSDQDERLRPHASLRDKFNEKDSDVSGQVDAEELGLKLIPVSVGTL